MYIVPKERRLCSFCPKVLCLKGEDAVILCYSADIINMGLNSMLDDPRSQNEFLVFLFELHMNLNIDTAY